MANQNAAFGLKPNSKLGSNVNSEGTTEYSIASVQAETYFQAIQLRWQVQVLF